MTVKYMRPVVRGADGKELPILFPPQARGRRVSGLFLICQDLDFSARGFQYLAQNPTLTSKTPQSDEGALEELIVRSVWLASVVTYGKCFVAADGRGVKLKPEDVESLDGALLECHKKLMTDRHEYVAHAGESLNEHGLFGFAIKNVSPLELMQVGFVLQATIPSREDCVRARQLCQALSSVVQERINGACDSLEADLRGLPADEVARMLKQSR